MQSRSVIERHERADQEKARRVTERELQNVEGNILEAVLKQQANVGDDVLLNSMNDEAFGWSEGEEENENEKENENENEEEDYVMDYTGLAGGLIPELDGISF